MDQIEIVLIEEEAQLIIDRFTPYWRATIRNERFGEIVNVAVSAYSSDLAGLLEKLNAKCGEYLTEMEIPF